MAFDLQQEQHVLETVFVGYPVQAFRSLIVRALLWLVFRPIMAVVFYVVKAERAEVTLRISKQNQKVVFSQ